jgi:hypothetical protein
MSYDPFTWRTNPTAKELLVIELANVEKEIAWNERRLAHLVLSDEDHQQTEDFIADLKLERERLLVVLNG